MDDITITEELVTDEIMNELVGIPIVLPDSVAFAKDNGRWDVAFIFKTVNGESIKFGMEASTFMQWSDQVNQELKIVLKPN